MPSFSPECVLIHLNPVTILHSERRKLYAILAFLSRALNKREYLMIIRDNFVHSA